jgi:hypothetical protein
MNTPSASGLERGIARRALIRAAPAARWVAAVAAAAMMHATAAASTGHSQEDPPESVSSMELKRAYLWCDGAAVAGELGAGGVQHCSLVYEELKRRAFDGDFARLLAWSRLNPSAQVTAHPGASTR